MSLTRKRITPAKQLLLLWYLLLQMTANQTTAVMLSSYNSLKAYPRRFVQSKLHLMRITRRMQKLSLKPRIPKMIEQTTVAPPIANGTEPKKRGRPRSNVQSGDLSAVSSSAQSNDGKRAPRIEAQLQEIDSGLSSLFQTGGSLISLIDPFSGNHITMNSGQFVRAVVKTARTDAKLRNWLLNFIHTTGYGEIISAAIILVLPIMIYHGLMPKRFFTSFGVEEDDNKEN